ncbi:MULTISPECIES: site-specific integrase [Acetobacter]|uniref:Tyr recombinase domain-containing protein n=2 Tax=Acetobacter TaxID=434 RepID=A0A401WY38_ACEPA|nr:MULTISPECIES: hypothetical protein [Acetobacter]PHY92651.1 hypothetical protein CSR02_15725 [Acetobacter pomorum]GBR47675.1 hypothetical protein AA11825_0745 [Acetobacter pomorum DSM 11825]GCD54226.1 hypothetical protein NBRC3188_2923 [Acetobacter pasteurianus NBRC 3188]
MSYKTDPINPLQAGHDKLERHISDHDRTIRKQLKDELLSSDGAVRPTEGSIPALSSPEYEKTTGQKKFINPETLADYRRRTLSKIDTYKVENCIPLPTPLELIDPVDFTLWMMAGKKELLSASWRVYRCALQYFLQEWPHDNTHKALQIIASDIHNRVHNVAEKNSTRKKRDGTEKTSAASPKRVPYKDYETLITYLRRASRSRMANTTADFFAAGIMTALRPDEWKMTEVCVVQSPSSQPIQQPLPQHTPPPASKSGRNHKVWLLVMSAKTTNNRGNGIVRTLDITNFSDAQINLIQRASETGRSYQERGEFKRLKNQISNVLEYAVKVLWPDTSAGEGKKISKKNYSLYCARHQAIANWKMAGIPETEISAMVGHGNAETAEENYARRAVGWSGKKRFPLPHGVPEEIASVEKRIGYHQAMAMRRRHAFMPSNNVGGPKL